MKLVVFSHKRCWFSNTSPSGFATHGGFPIQMQTLSQLFDATTLVLPCGEAPTHQGELPIQGKNLKVVPLTYLYGEGLSRKLRFPFWLLRNFITLFKQAQAADAIHAPIPGDIGTVGMSLAIVLGKPLFVRHCGNWLAPCTQAQHFWKWFMERFGGGRNVMLATGGSDTPPSQRNPHLRWIFSTSLAQEELATYAPQGSKELETSPRLIIVCRQEQYKGTDIVIKSLPLIRRQFPKLNLDVVGDGNALDAFRQLVIEQELEPYVHFHGKVNHEQVMALLQQATLFCYPTQASEGFPKVVLEALACGLPVITTRVSVLPYLIGDRCGNLLDQPTPEALACSVQYVLRNPHLYNRLSRNAINTAQDYSLEAWQNTIGALLEHSWGTLCNGA